MTTGPGSGAEEPGEGAGDLPPAPAREPARPKLDEEQARELISEYVDRALAREYEAKLLSVGGMIRRVEALNQSVGALKAEREELVRQARETLEELRQTLRESQEQSLAVTEKSQELSEHKRVLASFLTSLVSQINQAAERFLNIDDVLDEIERLHPDSDLAASRMEVRAENLRLVQFAETIGDAAEYFRTSDDPVAGEPDEPAPIPDTSAEGKADEEPPEQPPQPDKPPPAPAQRPDSDQRRDEHRDDVAAILFVAGPALLIAVTLTVIRWSIGYEPHWAMGMVEMCIGVNIGNTWTRLVVDMRRNRRRKRRARASGS